MVGGCELGPVAIGTIPTSAWPNAAGLRSRSIRRWLNQSAEHETPDVRGPRSARSWASLRTRRAGRRYGKQPLIAVRFCGTEHSPRTPEVHDGDPRHRRTFGCCCRRGDPHRGCRSVASAAGRERRSGQRRASGSPAQPPRALHTAASRSVSTCHHIHRPRFSPINRPASDRTRV